jgi:hypothetical protein
MPFVPDKEEGMKQIVTYLRINGNFEEVMEGYRNCVGASFTLKFAQINFDSILLKFIKFENATVNLFL